MNNYKLLETVELKDCNGIGYLYKHKKTNASIVVIKNDDTNKVFSACFPTIVNNSKGMPHILEHSVLCGSKKYPLRDPFVELMKGSMYTFLNAMTFDDMTLYPIASTNDKDFKNLMDVYLDAVFNPLAIRDKEIFEQEGWHYEINEGKLIYNGVVFNEMKGYMASGEYLLDHYIKKSLYPNSPYSYHSGGKPNDIVKLTYQEFVDFYSKHYHPSKCLLFMYGNIDLEERLSYLDSEYLSKYDNDHSKPYQFPSDYKPLKELSSTYYCKDNYAYFSYNTIVSNHHSLLDLMVLEIVDYVLVSSQGASIKSKLLKENIGQDVFSQISLNVNEPSYSIIVKNAKVEDKDRFFEIVRDNLDNLVLNDKQVKAALHMLQFNYRQQESRSPLGLLYNQQVLYKWLYHEHDIFNMLKIEDTLNLLSKIIEDNKFIDYVKELFNNPGSEVSLLPSNIEDNKEEKELDNTFSKMSNNEIDDIINNHKHLREYQDIKEDTSCIPILSKEDLPSTVINSVNEEILVNNTKIIYHDINTKGISYFKFCFDIRHLDLDKLPYASLLSEILGMVDTDKYSYLDLDNKINESTGGIVFGTNIYDCYTSNKTKLYFEIGARCLENEVNNVFMFIKEILLHSHFDNEKRIKELLNTEKASLESSFIDGAHSVAYHESRKNYCLADYYLDLTDYIGYYKNICDLLENFDINKFNEIYKQLVIDIFNSNNLIISYTGNKLEQVKELTINLLNSLNHTDLKNNILPTLSYNKCDKAYTIASSVNYVALSGYSKVNDIASYQVLKHILRCDYLWHHIRVKGGAYGCFALDNDYNMLTLVSYRDPHTKASLKVYEGIVNYIKNFNIDDRTLLKYIIGTINERETAITPLKLSNISFNRYIMEIDEEYLNNIRKQTINTTIEDIRSLSTLLQNMLDNSTYCVIGNKDNINRHKSLFTNVKPLY